MSSNNLLNSNFIIIPQNNDKNKEKQMLIKKRNADSARKGRLRKKLAIEQLMNENKLLKEKITLLKKELNEKLCPECKKKINTNFSFLISINPIKKFPLFLTSSIAIIFLFYFYNSQVNFKLPTKIIRHLNFFTREKYYLKQEDLFNLTSKPKNLYIRYGDYYSILNNNTFSNHKYYNFLKSDKIRMFYESNLTEEMKPEDHIDDMIKLNNNAIQYKGNNKFSLFLTPYYFHIPNYNEAFINNIENGNEIVSLYYELEFIGYSLHQVFLTNNNTYD